ncbi:conserved hypothetical protein [Xenorhabdus nematophila F1]|uniref:Uncharacterized protein n=1 Tax=Xenorhabdus nematophila (strain ATCC 19061 / DSM 3370 / CCUG 14189 / LMG 1036 / NCIMB 9965 / AN6) TaxID=406817 RepID=D3VHY7_XENNA|nr:hypothetical protein XNC1_0399 [Xenorhabdus nematophila ATCC 19061]CCW29718.1 conserved hypothetical protein [Xenorhabdus nematophila F1]CEK21391.1 hypothetical protein XNC2_0392 [Xenorhabdus nematophila AN6/1]
MKGKTFNDTLKLHKEIEEKEKRKQNVLGWQENKKEKAPLFAGLSQNLVGERGFEPPTHWSQTSCATKLRYSPKCLSLISFLWCEGGDLNPHVRKDTNT